MQDAPSDDWDIKLQDYVMVSPAHTDPSGGTPTSQGSEPSSTSAGIDGAYEDNEGTEFWFQFEESGSDCSSEAGEDPAADDVAGSCNDSTAIAESEEPHVCVHIVKHPRADSGCEGAMGPDNIRLHLHCHGDASNCDASSVWEIPGAICSSASDILGALPVLPKPRSHTTQGLARRGACAVPGPSAEAEDGALVSTAAGTAVWQLRPMGLDTGTINSPDAVRIPADSVLLVVDPTRCGGVVEFAAVNFKGGTIVVLCCQAVFHRCTFSACSVVVTGTEAAAAQFQGCAFTDTDVPAVIASGPAATVQIGSGARGERTLFQNCMQPLLVDGGGASHVTECDVTALRGDCFSVRGPSTRMTLENCTVDGTSLAPAPAARASPVSKGWGLRVSEGAEATVRRCRFDTLGGGAIRVESGALARVSDCDSIQSRDAAFFANSTGRLHLYDCRSVQSIRAAIQASGADTEIHATNLTAEACGIDGVVVKVGAHVWLKACKVSEAQDTALQVAGPGSQVWLEECTITECGRSGVVVGMGGAAELSCCSVSRAAKYGMHAAGAGASITAAGCTIHSHNEAAVSVCDGGSATLSKCKMELNAVGCRVRGGSQLSAHACESQGDSGAWLSVSGAGSTASASGCTVKRAVSSVVLVAEGAEVQLHECTLAQAACHAIIVRHPGTLIEVAHCTIAESGSSSVLVERDATALMRQTTVSSSNACGVEGRESATVAMDQCMVHACADVCVRITYFATAVARKCDFSSALNGGVDADAAGTAVLLACTFTDTGDAAVVANAASIVAAFGCVNSGTAVDYILRDEARQLMWSDPDSSRGNADDVQRDACCVDSQDEDADLPVWRAGPRQRRMPIKATLVHQECRRVGEGAAEFWDGVAAPFSWALQTATFSPMVLRDVRQCLGRLRSVAAFRDLEREASAALAAVEGNE